MSEAKGTLQNLTHNRGHYQQKFKSKTYVKHHPKMHLQTKFDTHKSNIKKVTATLIFPLYVSI